MAPRRRRDVVSRETSEEGALIRLAITPEGRAVPDLAARLPGRGVWVAANRAAIDAARGKGLVARSAKTPVALDPDLADRIELLLAQSCLSRLGLARRAGQVAAGFEQVRAALKEEGGAIALVLAGSDASADGRAKVVALAAAAAPKARHAGCFTMEELGAALGRGPTAHVAVRDGPAAQGLIGELARLAGFRAIIPPDWDKSSISVSGS